MTAAGTVRPYPFGEPHALDLEPIYQRLRSEEPLSRVVLPYGGEAWLATRFADARAVLADPRFSRAVTVGADVPRVRPEIDQNAASILNMDPPNHTRLRRLVATAFTARRVEQLRPRATELTAELLAGMRAVGPGADLVEHVSMPLPVTIICELLGVPVADRTIFRAGADAALSTSSRTPQEREAARTEMVAYMVGLIEQRRAEPREDLLSAMVAAHDDGDRASLRAGADARETITRGIEELLRYTPLGASAGFARIATEDVELSGVQVRAGEAVFAVVAAADRDPEVFDRPDELVLDRPTGPTLAFGYGPHHCLGAQLARMELQEAIGALLREFPDLRLAVPADEVPWRRGALVRGPERLPLAW
jgi:cytochrome P450